MQTYAIGDIHGHADLLRRAHDLIADDRVANGEPDSPIVHIGDLVDRGPDSRAVVGLLAEGRAERRNWITLKGNHDRMFQKFLDDPNWHDPGLRPELTWLHPHLGGATTLASYGVMDAGVRPLAEVHAEAIAAVPPAHRLFLSGLPTSYVRGDCVFVHAGIRPGVDLRDQTEDDLVWIRRGFLDDPRDFGPLIVHGHTAIDAPTHYGNRLNIDSSAAYGGPLSAVVIEGRDAWLLTPDGREPIRP
jgi:serine/threonine protein phosphatase 1